VPVGATELSLVPLKATRLNRAAATGSRRCVLEKRGRVKGEGDGEADRGGQSCCNLGVALQGMLHHQSLCLHASERALSEGAQERHAAAASCILGQFLGMWGHSRVRLPV
jgi:hypothetical protein